MGSESILQQIKKTVENADMLLIGIGEEFAYPEEQIRAEDYQNSCCYLKQLEEKSTQEIREHFEIYDRLVQLVKNKNYFVVTMCNDDFIFCSDMDKGRVTAPFGTRMKFRCSGECTDEVWQISDLQQQKELSPVCPHCNAVLVPNLIGREGYSEQGYLESWKRYQMWLTGTLNKNICILELGVGFRFPSVIRWPFEKVAALNQKAVFVRVNEQFPQIAEEIKEKSFSVQRNSKDFLKEITENNSERVSL